MARQQWAPSGEIRCYFAVDHTPAVEAPVELRKKWVGLLLPVRYNRRAGKRQPYRALGVETKRAVAGDDGVLVLGRDAIAALDRAGAGDAAAYWEVRLAQFAPALIFNAFEGRLLDLDEAHAIDPEISTVFD